jgi:hypothetical protein
MDETALSRSDGLVTSALEEAVSKG